WVTSMLSVSVALSVTVGMSMLSRGSLHHINRVSTQSSMGGVASINVIFTLQELPLAGCVKVADKGMPSNEAPNKVPCSLPSVSTMLMSKLLEQPIVLCNNIGA